MTELLTAAQMRAIEEAAINSGEVTGLELMERAGRGVVEAIFEEWPELATAPHRAVVLCGPGNNGGDGFVVARLLKEQSWDVEVFLYGDPAKLPPDALANYERWKLLGGVSSSDTQHENSCDLLVDAVFGTGLQRPVDDPNLWEWFWHIDDAIDIVDWQQSGDTKAWNAPRTIAVDIPSGLDSDTGEILGDTPPHGLRAPRVMLTVTFHRMKKGHVHGVGQEHCGKVVIKDIGL